MNLRGKETGVVVLIALLWVTVIICGWTGLWFAALIAGVALMLLHMVLGAAQEGIIDKKLLLYPIVSWSVVWVLGFVFAEYYAQAFMNQEPSFSVLGFHPSFAFIVLFYWIGGVLTLNIGLIVFSEQWLSKDKWQKFVDKVNLMESDEEVA